MSKKRTDYTYVAHRISPDHPQNLGDYSIRRRLGLNSSRSYHFDSRTGRLINRTDSAMPVIQRGSQIYRECMKAVDRMNAEETR